MLVLGRECEERGMAFLVIGEGGEDEVGFENDVCVRWDEVG